MIEKLNECIDKDNELQRLVDLTNQSIKNDEDNVIILEKMLIILMVTKLEVFLEKQTSEWFGNFKNNPINTVYNLPDIVKKEIIKDTVSKVWDELKSGSISNRNKNKLNNFNLLLDEFYPLSKLDVDFKITLNSHGSSEIKNLLRKIGIENVFGDMEHDYEKKRKMESLDDIHITSKIDFEGRMNKLVNYRNKIIHEDELGGLSYADLNEFIESINLLVTVVKEHLKRLDTSEDIKYVSE